MAAPAGRGSASTRGPWLAGVIMRAVAGCLGAGMIVLPVPYLTGRCLVPLPVRLVLAAAAAVIESAHGEPGLAVLAGEGLLILGYLLFVDAPYRMTAGVTMRWLRLQLPAVL